MEEIEYKSCIYYRNNGKWYNKTTNLEESIAKQSEINQYYNSRIDTTSKTCKELTEVADGYKKTKSYTMAISMYKKALEKSEEMENIEYILPRITSCYRQNGQPEKAIELYSKIRKKMENNS